MGTKKFKPGKQQVCQTLARCYLLLLQLPDDVKQQTGVISASTLDLQSTNDVEQTKILGVGEITTINETA